MKIDGSGLLIYLDGKPIGATTNESVELSRSTVDGIFDFGGIARFELPEMTFDQQIDYQWHRSKELPRKKKKAYRKYLTKVSIEHSIRQYLLQSMLDAHSKTS